MQASRHDLTTSIGLLILRLGFGGYMLTHGWGKLQMLFRGQFDEFPDPLGIGSGLSLTLAVLGEVLFPVLVILGLLTRLSAAPVVITMAVAAFVIHASDPWSGGSPSKELALLYLIAFLTLIFTGAGRYSLDAVVSPRLRSLLPGKRS